MQDIGYTTVRVSVYVPMLCVGMSVCMCGLCLHAGDHLTSHPLPLYIVPTLPLSSTHNQTEKDAL